MCQTITFRITLAKLGKSRFHCNKCPNGNYENSCIQMEGDVRMFKKTTKSYICFVTIRDYCRSFFEQHLQIT